MRTLQRLIIPALDVCPEVELYVRLSGPATLDVEDREVTLRKGGVVRTDTFFGVFSLGRWGALTSVRRVSVGLDVTGACVLETMVTGLDGKERVVDRQHVDASTSVVAGPELAELGAGLLWFRLTCDSAEARLRGLEVVTADEPARDVHLGVAITTYNRMAYVAVNLARLGRLFKEHPETAEDVSIVIVDNAANLELPIRGGMPVEIVKNPNLGGAGGFARGLWEHRRRGQATHVLFMDDDVAFEPEVIARTVAFLRFVKDDATCVAGSMMRMDQPAVQFEAGADLDPATRNLWLARGQAQNLLYTDVLLANERLEPFDYGAWWFYAFPLTTTDDYPPPVFVRGDDAYWGLRHTSGKSIAINGIGVWHADFDQKNGPTSAFYENRNVPIIAALAYPDHTAAELRRRVVDFTLRSIFSFRYDWAQAILDGVEAFLDGPDALMAVDPAALHAELRTRYPAEKLRAMTEEEMELPDIRAASRLAALVMRPIALVTLGGNLLPKVVRSADPVVIYLQHRSVMAGVLRDELLYRFMPTAEGFTARRDRRRAFALLRRTSRVARRITAEHDRVAAAYREAEAEMTSAAFWERKFADPASR